MRVSHITYFFGFETVKAFFCIALFACRMAIKQWPDSVYVLANYVTLFLNSNCGAKLSINTADACLRRARAMAPGSPLLAGHQWSLRDVYRSGGNLSPILEEGEVGSVDIGGWSAEKEKVLLSIAARLYPAALQRRQHLGRPAEHAAAAPEEREEGLGQTPCPESEADKGPDSFWSPKLRRNVKSNPGTLSPAPSPNPSPVSTRFPGSTARMRSPPISGPLRR